MTAALGNVLAALERAGSKPKRSGSRWMAHCPCPAHADGKPSLSVGDGTKAVVIKCFAGCDLGAVLEALGLSYNDLFYDAKPPDDPVVAEYVYEDADGRPIYRICRTADKGFFAQHPDGVGGWHRGLCGATVIPYQLRYVIEAVKAGKRVFIAEGEKDCDTLFKAGEIATCNPFGAGKWPGSFAQYFRGANVVIVADKDDTGRAHAHSIHASLEGVVDEISIVEPKEGKDAHDHLEAGHTIDAFRPVDLRPNETALGDDGPQPLFDVLTAQAFCERYVQRADDERDHLVGPLVVGGARIVIGAHSGHGKTTLALALVKAVVQGGDFLGYSAAGGGRALILDAEQGERAIYRRLSEAGLHESEDVDVIAVPAGMSLESDATQREELEGIFDRGSYALVLVDPLNKLHTGEANDERSMGDLMRVFDGWRAKYGFALLQPAHLRKPPLDGKRPTIHDISGHNVIVTGAEVVLGIQRVRDGYSKLWFWKDRLGDLPPIDTALGLLFARDAGFRLDPDAGRPKETAIDQVRAILRAERRLDYDTIRARTKNPDTGKPYGDKSVREAIKALDTLEELADDGKTKLWSLSPEETA